MISIDDNPNIHHLHYEDKEITLVGTAHVSRESSNLVKEIIEHEQPETVCIELCESRYHALTQKKLWQETNLIKVVREKKAFLLLANLMLASFHKKSCRPSSRQNRREHRYTSRTAISASPSAGPGG
jgi:pheromone shutdown protein TraB